MSLGSVQHWVARAGQQDLDEVDWRTHAPGARSAVNRCSEEVELAVLRIRQELQKTSDLGEFGAAAIRSALLQSQELPSSAPAVRTIGRILERHGVLDRHYRQRRAAPPKGWYLPDVVAARVELDLFDVVVGLVIKDGPEVEVLNAVSLHGGLIGCWPQASVTAARVRAGLLEHWQDCGLPGYAQFDNDTRFQGPHQHPDAISSVMRLCLSLGVTPVFAPPREMGFQAAIEAANARWQEKVWKRFHFDAMDALQTQSLRYQTAHRSRGAQRQEAAPPRRSFPSAWQLDLQAHPQGRIIFLRRTNNRGQAHLLGRTFDVDPQWPLRLLRAEVDLDLQRIRFFRLRRHEPQQQPLIHEVPYVLPRRPFRLRETE